MKIHAKYSEDVLKKLEQDMKAGNEWMAYWLNARSLRVNNFYSFPTKSDALDFQGGRNAIYHGICPIKALIKLLKEIFAMKEMKIPVVIHLNPVELMKKHELDNKLNLKDMNEKNLEYLKDNIKYHGFGETLNPELESQLKKGVSDFSIAFKTEVNKKAIEATLHFKKSDTTDLYFFNKYDVRAQLEKKDETLSQTFYINKGHGVTLKEAYNLLNGRAVHKELTDKQDQKYQAWIQLDFNLKDKNGNFERKQYHQNYGYDLKEALSYYPIKDFTNSDDKAKIMRSLEKGNVQQVTIDVSGKETKVFIEANPQYKTVTLYNGKMQRLDQEQRQELMVKPSLSAGKEQRQEIGKGESKEQGKNLTQDVKKVKNDLNDDIDIPKKNNRKKGMSV